jgi:hypothetical protein
MFRHDGVEGVYRAL